MLESLLIDVQTFEEAAVVWLKLYTPRILSAVIHLIVGYLIALFVRRYAYKAVIKFSEAILAKFISTTLFLLLLIFSLISALSALGVQTASIIAVLGAAGLAIALSLKNSLSNIASGIVLIIFRPFRYGDSIEINNITGNVLEINLYHTLILTADNRSVTIPNSMISSNRIINFSKSPTRRIDWTLVLDYGSDIQQVKQIIYSLLQEESKILTEPKPFIGVVNLGSKGVELAVRVWVKKEDFSAIQVAYNESFQQKFKESGIYFAKEM
ncbi:hypothetical protein CCZ01_00200 [Helicobacter monodelphidis]|uniref:mechanosensitive ion channel family protein n=1 Tax=Helicobacter sp. 15-1451 TaxID=2004995 RepID=UPI000DCD50AD|nr:mechanosensitive ion channel domain-containing protein [Helicobacter sp. 15-1451]RAX59203.1 hypothetical protein CCZ01_00200 [Helicobacter sp. 15-1451]